MRTEPVHGLLVLLLTLTANLPHSATHATTNKLVSVWTAQKTIDGSGSSSKGKQRVDRMVEVLKKEVSGSESIGWETAAIGAAGSPSCWMETAGLEAPWNSRTSSTGD